MMNGNSDAAGTSDGSTSGGGDCQPSEQASRSASAAAAVAVSQLPPQPEAVRVLTELLKEEPKVEEMSIAILRADSPDGDAYDGSGGSGHGGGGDDGDNGGAGAGASAASSYPTNAFKKVDEHLGLHAPDLPRLARDFRDDYYALRELFRRISPSPRQEPSWSRQQPVHSHCRAPSSCSADAPVVLSANGGEAIAIEMDSTTNTSGTSFTSGGADGDGLSQSAAAPPATAAAGAGADNIIESVVLRQRIMDATSCLLLTCPDNATAWSDRRRALLLAEGDAEGHMSSRKVINIFIAELKFLDLLFTHHSKAPNAWAHRKWICFRIVRDKISWNIRPTTEDQWCLLQPWAQREVDLCTRVAEHFPNNYFAWAHRSYVISILFNHWPKDGKKYLSDVSVAGSLRSFLAGEVMSIEQWLSRHVSDHAAAHYGTEALRLHLKHGFRSGAGVLRKKSGTAMEWALAVVEGMLITSKHLVKRYSSHEVVWVWRRHIGQIFLDIMCCEFGTEKLVDSEAVEALNRFLQAHIYDVYDDIMNGGKATNLNKTKIKPEEEEVRFSKLHGLTYLLWLLDQLQRRSALIGFVHDKDHLNKVRDACKNTLAKDDSISYNTWRLKKVSEDPL